MVFGKAVEMVKTQTVREWTISMGLWAHVAALLGLGSSKEWAQSPDRNKANSAS